MSDELHLAVPPALARLRRVQSLNRQCRAIVDQISRIWPWLPSPEQAVLRPVDVGQVCSRVNARHNDVADPARRGRPATAHVAGQLPSDTGAPVALQDIYCRILDVISLTKDASQ